MYGETVKINIDVTAYGKALNEGNVSVYINSKDYAANVVNGTATIEISNLSTGAYETNVLFDAGENYTTSAKLIKFSVLKQNTVIEASTRTYVINYDGEYSIVFKDKNGNVIAGKKITFTLNGKNIGSATTDSHGFASIKLTAKILKTAKAGKKNIVIKFEGDDNYNAISKTVKITINKEKTKITAKKKTFKKSKKVKKYAITLKNSKGKAVKKVPVTLKIKGKIFKAKTNNKGKAIFKIKKFTKKGNFKAKITFKGNNYYLKVNKKVKIKIK